MSREAPTANPCRMAAFAGNSSTATERSEPEGSYKGHGSAEHGGTLVRAATTRPSASIQSRSSGKRIPFIQIGCRAGSVHFSSRPSDPRAPRPASPDERDVGVSATSTTSCLLAVSMWIVGSRSSASRIQIDAASRGITIPAAIRVCRCAMNPACNEEIMRYPREKRSAANGRTALADGARLLHGDPSYVGAASSWAYHILWKYLGRRRQSVYNHRLGRSPNRAKVRGSQEPLRIPQRVE